jgi:hypothetical protein
MKTLFGLWYEYRVATVISVAAVVGLLLLLLFEMPAPRDLMYLQSPPGPYVSGQSMGEYILGLQPAHPKP